MLGLLFTLASAVAPVPPADAKKETAALQGEWVAVAVSQRGAAEPADRVKATRLTLTVEGDTFTLSTVTGKERSGKYRLASSRRSEAARARPDCGVCRTQ